MLFDIIKAAILGIVEGLTEFIPVSSTGHLILASAVLPFSKGNAATFDIAIQLGAILSVVVLYRDFFIETFSPKGWLKKDMKIIAVAILPAILIGFITHSYIKHYLFSPFTVAIGLLVGAILMIVTEKILRIKPTTKSIDEISYFQALGIGITQCFSLWPGFSRSGSTIVGGLLVGMDYKTSAKFSFIIAVPVMLLAVGYDLIKSASTLSLSDAYLIGVGFVMSFIVGMAAIVGFMKLLERFKLFPFAVYRIILAMIILIIHFG